VSCDIEEKKEKSKPWRNNSKSLALVFFVLCFRKLLNQKSPHSFIGQQQMHQLQQQLEMSKEIVLSFPRVISSHFQHYFRQN
jgi:hypothetical protein